MPVTSLVPMGQAVLGGGQMSVPGKYSISQPADGSRIVISSPITGKQPVAGIEQRQTVSPAVLQSDELDVDSISSGKSIVIDFGQISILLDQSGSGNELAAGEVLMIDPNGVPHDLSVWTRTKADNYDPPGLSPGRYTFYNISGGALTNHAIFIVHVGSRNLA